MLVTRYGLGNKKVRASFALACACLHLEEVARCEQGPHPRAHRHTVAWQPLHKAVQVAAAPHLRHMRLRQRIGD